MKAKVVKAINEQIKVEEESARLYFAMGNWCEVQGYPGSAKYLYEQADEERMHMTKLVKYLADRNEFPTTQALEEPQNHWDNIHDVFKGVLEHEQKVTELINNLYEVCLQEKDHLSSNFLRWYIEEQVEEEGTARAVLDRLELASAAEGGLFHFDKEMETASAQEA